MRILEIQMKNFGKFSNKTIRFHEGINLFYGKNEAGKSTIHSFLRAMLFGMEKARGRGAKNDEYSLREPWENPGYFAGVMRFESGGKVFRLERNFNRREKRAALVCETDGEELSVEDGDLDVLLEGMNAVSYSNTFFIGQRGAATEEGLAQELHNYMSNLQNAGDTEIDVKKACASLEAKRHRIEAEKKKAQAAADARRREQETRLAYVKQETERLAAEETECEDKLRKLEYWLAAGSTEKTKPAEKEAERFPCTETEKSQKNRKRNEEWPGQQRTGKSTERNRQDRNSSPRRGISGGEIFAAVVLGIAGILGSIFLPWPWLKYVSGVVCACAAFDLLKIIWQNRNWEEEETWRTTDKDEAEDWQTAEKGQKEKWRQADEDEKETQQEQTLQKKMQQLSAQAEKQKGHLERIRSELREKQTIQENLRENLNELPEEKEDAARWNREIAALRMAADMIEEASKEVYSQWEGRLNRRVSEILSEITEGRYTRIFLDANLQIRIHTPDKLLGIWQVSKGTMEQVYFALRMAAGEIFAGGEEVPVILDEAFAMYDDGRLEQTLRWLVKNKKQVILFTCQDRESRILSEILEEE